MVEEMEAVEKLKDLADFHIGLANRHLDEFEEHIKNCKISIAIPTFKNIYVHTKKAYEYIYKLPPANQKEDVLKKIDSIEKKSFDVVSNFSNFCECKPIEK